MTDVVLMDIEEDVAVLTLNRPDRLNAWTPALRTRYADLLEECAEREDVRAIVVTGAGRGFCAGADMEYLQALSTGDDAPSDAEDARSVTVALSIPKPIIAAINGPCAGIGLILALYCDLRFAAADAKITTAFARRGLVGEHGITWMLTRLVGHGRALDLLLSARVLLGAEAAELGLVNRAVEGDGVLAEAISYARELARECSPASMAALKGQVYADYDRTLAQGLAEGNRLMLEVLTTPDVAEGVRSFVERRSPRFDPVTAAVRDPGGTRSRHEATGAAPR